MMDPGDLVSEAFSRRLILVIMARKHDYKTSVVFSNYRSFHLYALSDVGVCLIKSPVLLSTSIIRAPWQTPQNLLLQTTDMNENAFASRGLILVGRS